MSVVGAAANASNVRFRVKVTEHSIELFPKKFEADKSPQFLLYKMEICRTLKAYGKRFRRTSHHQHSMLSLCIIAAGLLLGAQSKSMSHPEEQASRPASG